MLFGHSWWWSLHFQNQDRHSDSRVQRFLHWNHRWTHLQNRSVYQEQWIQVEAVGCPRNSSKRSNFPIWNLVVIDTKIENPTNFTNRPSKSWKSVKIANHCTSPLTIEWNKSIWQCVIADTTIASDVLRIRTVAGIRTTTFANPTNWDCCRWVSGTIIPNSNEKCPLQSGCWQWDVRCLRL